MSDFKRLKQPAELLPIGTTYDNMWYVATVDTYDEDGKLLKGDSHKTWFLYPNGKVCYLAAQYDSNNNVVEHCFFDTEQEAQEAIMDYYILHGKITYSGDDKDDVKSQDLFND